MATNNFRSVHLNWHDRGAIDEPSPVKVQTRFGAVLDAASWVELQFGTDEVTLFAKSPERLIELVEQLCDELTARVANYLKLVDAELVKTTGPFDVLP